MNTLSEKLSPDKVRIEVCEYANLYYRVKENEKNHSITNDTFENYLEQKSEYENNISDKAFEIALISIRLLDSVKEYSEELFKAITESNSVAPLELFENGYVGFKSDYKALGSQSVFLQSTDTNHWIDSALFNSDGTVDYSEQERFINELESVLVERIDTYINHLINCA